MTAKTRVLTSDDLLGMPDDGFRYELVKGELIKMSPAGHQHGRIAATITAALGSYVRENELGVVYAAETGFKLASNPDTVRAPDVAFVRKEGVLAVGDTGGYWPGAPDLAVEVISPNDLYADVADKHFDWLDAGTRLVIVVNPRHRTVEVYRSLTDIALLKEGDAIEGCDVVPGWTMAVGEAFR